MRELHLNFLLLLVLIFTNSGCFCSEIHILRVKRPTKKEVQAFGLPSFESKYSQMCLSIMQTYRLIGQHSFDIYKLCNGGYNLLGSSNKLIKETKPFCYNGLQQFFCLRNIRTRETNTCKNEELLSLILTSIKGCLIEAEQVYGANNNERYKCPTLNFTSLKILNREIFCRQLQKKQVFTSKDHSLKYTYSSVKPKEFNTCMHITEIYNSCIDSNNLLFPGKNYKECLNPQNTLYLCTNQRNYNKEEVEICSDFVLPTIANYSLKMNIFEQDRNFCQDFEKKIVREYQGTLKLVGDDIKTVNDQIKVLNNKALNIEKVREGSNQLLNSLIAVNKLWEIFYETFSTTFKLRSSITKSEYKELVSLKRIFDTLFPYSAKLNSLVNDKQFLKIPLSNIFDSIKAYFEKGHEITNRLSKVLTSFNKILLRNKILTSSNTNTAPQKKGSKITNSTSRIKVEYMQTQKLSSEEVRKFEDEYVSMQLYIKNFLNNVMKRSKSELLKLECDKKNEQAKIAKMNFYLNHLNEQKQLLYKKLLNDKHN